ncbi:hypothetical protein Mcup_1465 [Metallosphaera cuprina Ar-4]|uniref:Uncharacterized protein n=1 Tax=Metallosphaera cuprina (strain Ar-4) TaxID=1006006 RepID=F4FYZ9_METCR|nr:hypothetical protein Mcup_1465 [Metallosphaera cuprina Ar-4]
MSNTTTTTYVVKERTGGTTPNRKYPPSERQTELAISKAV